MAGDHLSILQDAFLNQARQKKILVTIFLMNGVKLQGMIVWFDAYSVLLKRDHMSQLVFKHAISTVMPMAPMTLHYGAEGGAGKESSDKEGDEDKDSEEEED